MSQTIEGVPESITREQYADLIASVGLDPKGLRSLEFRLDGIYAELIARDSDGKLLIDSQRNEVVTHRLYIRVEG